VGAEITVAKRMTNLALLGKLGMAQLAETGATISQAGFENWWRRGPMALFDQQLRDANRALLDDMAYIVGDIGQDHKHFAPHMNLDEVSALDRADWLKQVGQLSSNGQWLQNYTSAFNTVRSLQQQVAAAGMADKVFRSIRDGLDEATERRFRDDLGLMPEDIRELESLIQSGVIEFGSRGSSSFVNRLNMDQWEPEIADVFGSSIMRNLNQVVQKSMAGEQDAWMHTTWGSVITHLKTFPMAAIQKQFIRNMRHMDQGSITILLYGMATAGVATAVKDAIDGKERTPTERARIAFGYANVTGWTPMFWDPTMNALGLEDYRINAFGPVSDFTPAMFSWGTKAARLPGAVHDTLTGQDDYYDRQSIKALPFANTLGLSRLLD
jgi:hypothetical protein